MKPTRIVRGARLGVLALLVWLGGWSGQKAGAQPQPNEERLNILTDPESVKAKIEKEKLRPPLEIFRSQIAPFDILPFVKPNHWSTLSLEMRANNDDYAGLLQSEAVPLAGSPQAMIFRRDARLPKAQRMRLSMQIMLPQVPREMELQLIRPDGVRADENWRASLRYLDPHQMLVVVLTRGSSDGYAQWGRMLAFTPTSVDPTEYATSDRQRYYRVVLPMEPEHPQLSSHPLTWTTISHVLWDGMSPETLGAGQQQAMLDWLHWGGQLILIGGATPAFGLLRGSFLDSYLPADPSGEGVTLGEAELKGLSAAYPPPMHYDDPTAVPFLQPGEEFPGPHFGRRYRGPEPIQPAANRPVYVAGLKPREGARVIPLDESSGRLLGVERRVGRGRVLMLTVNPTDVALATWPGLDTMVRRVVLRRPEETLARDSPPVESGASPPLFRILSGPELSWYRLLSRDFTSQNPRPEPPRNEPDAQAATPVGLSPNWAAQRSRRFLRDFPRAPVAEWNDASVLPRLCRDELERASGITIPSSTFVLKVIIAYLIALVPLNWLICRYLLGRREWAWIVVPILALGFAVGVDRAAAYDMGYDTACDEIDVVEVYGDYPRAHVSRFASIYSTGRSKYTISFPGDPNALALPLDIGRSLRGEGITTSIWQSYPAPALDAFSVQPRSLAMFRSEQMVNLAGSLVLQRDSSGQQIWNASELALENATLIDVDGPGRRTESYLGTIAPGATVTVQRGRSVSGPKVREGLNPQVLLREFREYHEDRPENQGELRLVGWAPRPYGGLKLDPAVDRHRGFSVVVVHLRNGPPPAPDGPSIMTEGGGNPR